MKYFYTLQRAKNGAYEHIYARLYGDDEPYTWTRDELFTFKWQGDMDTDHWYGFHFEMDCGHSPTKAIEIMRHATGIMRRLKDANVIIDRPLDVIAVLEAAKIKRRVYDDRESGYLNIEDVQPQQFRRWMAWVTDSCAVSALATDEYSARQVLFKKFAEEAANGRTSIQERFKQWVTSGEPVRCDDCRKFPDLRDTADILRPVKEPLPVVIFGTEAAAA